MKHTLKLTFPLGQTFGLAVLILVGMSLVLEVIARLPQIKTRIHTAIGSGHPDFDVKFGELEYLSEYHGQVDCVFMGTSPLTHSRTGRWPG